MGNYKTIIVQAIKSSIKSITRIAGASQMIKVNAIDNESITHANYII